MLENALQNLQDLTSPEWVVAKANRVWAPPPRLKVSEWADAKRVLSSTSAEPGQWRTSRAPYLRGVMDAVSDPQVSKTEGLINNTVGYHIDQDPAPILIVLETEPKAEAWSK